MTHGILILKVHISCT